MPQISALFIYRLVFLLELVISEGMFCLRIKRRRYFWYKLAGCLALIILITVFYPLSFFNWWYTSLMFTIIFILTCAAMFLLFDERISTISFLGVAAYLVQHISYQAFNSIENFAGLTNQSSAGVYGQQVLTSAEFSVATIFINIAVYLGVYFFCFIFFANKIKKNTVVQIDSSYLVFFIAFILVFIVGTNAYVVYNFKQDIPLMFMGLFNVLALFCCTLSLAFMFKLLNQRKMSDELDDAFRIIRQEKKQYELSKNNIELINQRVHDLKHQMEAIVSNANIRTDVVKEMTSAIKIYDSSIKTGNTVLDTILTEKSLECNQKNIKITCLIDGKQLSFISELDLYTFFGNALDNAIESVSKLPEEKRAISLTLNEKGNYYSLVIQNYTENKPVTITSDDGKTLIKSSKKDPFHGYGMRSMESIAEKYGGNITFDITDGIFSLYALFVKKEDPSALEQKK